jgi:hypothetical protein
MEGVQVDFQKLATDWALLETVQDYENLITRYDFVVLGCSSVAQLVVRRLAIRQGGVRISARRHPMEVPPTAVKLRIWASANVYE